MTGLTIREASANSDFAFQFRVPGVARKATVRQDMHVSPRIQVAPLPTIDTHAPIAGPLDIEVTFHMGSLDEANQMIEIAAADGHILSAYVARPLAGVRGGVVVVQSAYGVGAHIRAVCDSYADDGYVAIAPSLYDRQQRGAVFSYSPDDKKLSRRLRAGLSWSHVLMDIAAAHEQVACLGRVGIVGFCVGGSVSWLAAATQSFAAASAYYGSDIVDLLDRRPACPIILHFGERDHLISLADVERIRAAYPETPLYMYNAGHGFDGVGEGADPCAAQAARERTLALFRRYIG
jgi:carboxymethylenebutenolidase